MMNWMMRMASQSQSENWLAVSGDFSDNGVDERGDLNDLEVDLLDNEQQHPQPHQQQFDFIKHRLSSSTSTTSSSPSRTVAPSNSPTVSSLNLNLNPQTASLYTLSPLKRWLVRPTCTLTFLVILPFINGCLYTVGYRIGKRVLKMILNKSSN